MMKNFLSLDNLNLEINPNFHLSDIIQSTSEVESCPITNLLESKFKSIWISDESLPQEITFFLNSKFFKTMPKKITAIGIYCWHAYPTNPKLIEVLISKNFGEKKSFGNFDLCLKAGRQLLQLEDEDNFLTPKFNDNYTINLIIKETYGDKRTYINNLYLYENIDFFGLNIMNSETNENNDHNNKNKINEIDTIKEEEESYSAIYLRESREKTLPRKKNNINNNNLIINNNNENINLNSSIDNISTIRKQNIPNNKDMTLEEFGLISKRIEKNQNGGEQDNNILLDGGDSQFMATYSELSEKNNIIKLEPEKEINLPAKLETFEILTNSKLNTNKKAIDTNENEAKEILLSSSSSEESFDLFKASKSQQKNYFKIPNPNKKIDSNKVTSKIKTQNILNNKNKEIDQLKTDMKTLLDEFLKYKNNQEIILSNYENKINILEYKVSELQTKNINLENTIQNLLQNQKNNEKESLLSEMQQIANDTFVNIFSNMINLNQISKNSQSTHNINNSGSNLNDEKENRVFTPIIQEKKKNNIAQQRPYSKGKIIKPKNFQKTKNNDIIKNEINEIKEINNEDLKHELKNNKSNKNFRIQRKLIDQSIEISDINNNDLNSQELNKANQNTYNNQNNLNNLNIFYKTGFPNEYFKKKPKTIIKNQTQPIYDLPFSPNSQNSISNTDCNKLVENNNSSMTNETGDYPLKLSQLRSDYKKSFSIQRGDGNFDSLENKIITERLVKYSPSKVKKIMRDDMPQVKRSSESNSLAYKRKLKISFKNDSLMNLIHKYNSNIREENNEG